VSHRLVIAICSYITEHLTKGTSYSANMNMKSDVVYWLLSFPTTAKPRFKLTVVFKASIAKMVHFRDEVTNNHRQAGYRMVPVSMTFGDPGGKSKYVKNGAR